MPLSSEISPGLEVRPEEFEVPEEVKQELDKLGIKAVEKEYKTPVRDDRGQNLVQSPALEEITIQIPENQDQLATLVKGPKDEAVTWWAAFWMRVFKKSLHLGRRVIFGGKS